MNSAQEKLAAAIATASGLQLGPDKTYLLDARLASVMREFSVASYDQAVLDFEARPEFRARVVDAITTHETSFFRDEAIFRALPEQILPELAAHRQTPESQLELSIWSAACATGQEPYSILMQLEESGKYNLTEIQVTATDCAHDTLERARNGRFTKFQVSRGLSPARLARHFDAEGDGYRIKAGLRQGVQFLEHNLISDPPPGRFDIVFCRNVVIYFSEPSRIRALDAVIRSIKPDGVLIIGASETLAGAFKGYVIRHFGKVFYYEMKSSNITLF
ncbi:MAG: hypothetical protein K1X75_02595 [Leptospirales bacterium]|nr:hypothetical protein [Leptospirales bacterium]